MKPPSTAAPAAISVKRVRFIFYLLVSSSSEFLRFQVNDRQSMLPVTFLLHFCSDVRIGRSSSGPLLGLGISSYRFYGNGGAKFLRNCEMRSVKQTK
jgi:hypothetical protein